MSLFRVGWRHSTAHPLQSLLLVLGIALGVAVIVAIDLANAGVSRSFQLSTESLTGKATHQILGGPMGLDQEIYRRLRVDLGLRKAAPTIQGILKVQELNGKTMSLMGVDPFAESGFRNYMQSGGTSLSEKVLIPFLTEAQGVLLSQDLAEKHGLKVGSELTLLNRGKETSVKILGLLQSKDSLTRSALSGLLLTDIATAQEILEMGKRISSIDLILESEEEVRQIQKILPASVRVLPAKSQASAIREMSRSFELNLTAMSLLALLVGMFLIYNTVTFSVVQRRRLLGILRSLGVTQREIFTMILSESLLLGIVGTVLGLLLGTALGFGTLKVVTRTIDDLYFTLTVNQFYLSPFSLMKGTVVGLTACFFSSFFPALEATRVTPHQAMGRSHLESRILSFIPWLTGFGAILFLIGVLCLAIPTRSLGLSFVGLFALVFAMALWVPLWTQVGMKWLIQLFSWYPGIIWKLSSRNVTRSLSRSAVSIASQMIAVSVIVGVGTMVGSFRLTVIQWLEDTIKADIYVSSAIRYSNLNQGFLGELKSLPGIQAIYTAKSIPITSGSLIVLNEDLSKRTWLWTAGSSQQVYPAFDAGAVFISETYAWNHQLEGAEGLKITISTDQGPQEFPVAGIYSDFSSPKGVVIMKESTYQSYWKDWGVTAVALFVQKEFQVDQVIDQIEKQYSQDYSFRALSNAGIRQAAIETFDRTFTITIALQILAALVAFIGILNTIMALMLERVREIGILRANGLTRTQLWQLILAESGLLGSIAGLFALPLGTLMAWILVFIINKRSFGWTLEFLPQWESYAQALSVSIIAALIAGIYPAYKIARVPISQALRTE